MNSGATHSALLGYILERYTRIVRDNSQDFLIFVHILIEKSSFCHSTYNNYVLT